MLFISCSIQEDGLNSLNDGLNFYKNKNYSSAIESFEKSCDNGISIGCYNLGITIEQKISFYNKWYYGNDIYQAFKEGCRLSSKDSCDKTNKWVSYKDSTNWFTIIIGLIFIVFIIRLLNTPEGRKNAAREVFDNVVD